jgi:hypothetical protein
MPKKTFTSGADGEGTEAKVPLSVATVAARVAAVMTITAASTNADPTKRTAPLAPAVGICVDLSLFPLCMVYPPGSKS